MNTATLSILFFVIGSVEYFIDQWEKLVSVRLKIFSTLWYSILNNAIDFLMYVFLFGILIQFWSNWHNGVHDFYKLIPYVAYTIGKVAGTILALYIYAELKKKKDREKVILLASKQQKKTGKRRTKKQKAKDDKHNSNVAATMLDPVEMEDLKSEVKERTIEAATQKITERINEAFNNEEK